MGYKKGYNFKNEYKVTGTKQIEYIKKELKFFLVGY